MTLLYMDGFAHQNTARYIAGTQTFISTNPRVTSGWSVKSSVGTLKKSFTATSETFIGFGYRPANVSDANHQIATFFGDAGATQHITLVSNGSGLLEVRRGANSGTLLGTGATTLVVSAWVYIEMRITVADSGGIVQVRLNGSSSNEINVSGDTKNAGTNTTLDTLGLGGSNNSDQWTDVYLLNTSGSTNNTWLGDVTVRTLSPSGNGNSSALVGSDGNSVNNYQQVDELPYASADYNGSANSNDKDTYAFSDLPSGVTTIYATQAGAYAAKSDAGAKQMKIVTRSGGTDYNPTTTTLSTSYVEYLELREQDPATSAAWGASGVNNAEFGMVVV